jgi:predicted lipoprotein with Yx(FWY)xxD motif
VTLDGHPLYYFAGDETADDVNGQGVEDVWYVVSPEGEAITA